MSLVLAQERHTRSQALGVSCVRTAPGGGTGPARQANAYGNVTTTTDVSVTWRGNRMREDDCGASKPKRCCNNEA